MHPEVGGWDLVLTVDTAGGHTGSEFGVDNTANWKEQVGIQAKLQANVKVLHQAVAASPKGPARRVVLVRRADPEFIEVAHRLGLAVVTREVRRRVFGRNTPWVRPEGGFRVWGYPKVWPGPQLMLPAIVTNLPAGGPAPRQLTEWRIKALRICRILRERGYLTHKDFKDAKVDKRVWLQKWLDVREQPAYTGLKSSYVARPGATLPDNGDWQEISLSLGIHEQKGTP